MKKRNDHLSCERLRPLLKRLSLEDVERRRYDKELKKVGNT